VTKNGITVVQKSALSNAERQRLYIQRLKEQARAPCPAASKTKQATTKAQSRKAWLKVMQEGRAHREATLGWQQRLENILLAATGIASTAAVDEIKQEAWELFRVRWKP
jgi:hypothetical protein